MYRSMKSLALLGLLAPAYAHPASGHKSTLARRGVDIESFRLPQLGSYTNATQTETSPPIALLKRQSYVDTATELVKKLAPNAEFRVVGDHYVGTNGIAHVNFKQTAHGLDIDNADFNVNIGKDGKVFSFGNNFFSGEIPEASPLNKREFKDPVSALNGAKDVLQLPVESADASAEAKEGKEIYAIKGTSGAVADPEAKLVYLVKGDGKLALTWRVETDIVDNWLLTYVDAETSGEVHGVVDYVSDLANYRVYPWGVNDPTEGSRSLVTDPWDIAASEFTWHSDGPGSNYTTTRGNNAIAQSNPSGGSSYLNNYRPNSPSLNFDYEYSTSLTTPSTYIDASIAQLFYTANHYHDLLHELGFNERAGNFEINNNGAGGAGNDYVILNAQDGSGTNNANFATPPDGQPGRMRMYLWTTATPRRDCSFEAGVVIHEYTHGLSTRLTGGPANSGCLSALESGGMGEGWGDFMATAIRLKPADTRAKDYSMGAWVNNNPAGIRSVLYSTSLTTTPNTYSTINGLTSVHAIGTTWAVMLYEVLWNLIDKHGKNDGPRPSFDANGVPTDGKYLTLKLVIDAMALQPCSPNFIQARDAILDADTALTGGDNQCEIWTAFAKRGLGSDAVYSSSNRRNGFTIPTGVC
ncbi:extracellular elastinolytic metalloproteinase [Colletotrichum karsti]|uniref:Extracellular metalloproteinase n=1 Tax=Colletotrichum karsti TaxID=1095194 RepID=A0A9P6IH33_9PEZI|nr:extracellular elastinolytic metalloproteinase [Colletotrichum karsti]KAF9880551.1 extracellular elastinolytic metalloproteinase [Colletotrichum karsti]